MLLPPHRDWLPLRFYELLFDLSKTQLCPSIIIPVEDYLAVVLPRLICILLNTKEEFKNTYQPFNFHIMNLHFCSKLDSANNEVF